MKQAIYPGSFDPWTYGHQFVLESACEIFDCIHVVAAFNPFKSSLLKAKLRTRLTAHAIDPFTDWWKLEPPFSIGKKVVVLYMDGLIANYAKKYNIPYLIRGLRSTSDFEAEFNLYFSNNAIAPHLHTWAVMCPPHLLHCSSTFAKTVMGQRGVTFVGTSFTAQSIILGFSKSIGHLFDLIMVCLKHKFEGENLFHLNINHLYEALQILFTELYHRYFNSPLQINCDLFEEYFEMQRFNLKSAVQKKNELLKSYVNELWAILAKTLEKHQDFLSKEFKNGFESIKCLFDLVGKTSGLIFDESESLKYYESLS